MKGIETWCRGPAVAAAWILLIVTLPSCREAEERDAGLEGDRDAENEEPVYHLAKEGHLPPVGTKWTISREMEMRDAPMMMRMGDQRIIGTMSSSEEKVVRYEVLAPDKVRVLISKDERRLSYRVDGTPQEQPGQVHPLEGQPITFVQREGQWELDDAEEDLVEEQVAELIEGFSEEESLRMFGTEARKVGEEWTENTGAGLRMAGQSGFEGTVRLRFDRIEERESGRVAVIVARLDLTSEPPAVSLPDVPVFSVRVSGTATTWRDLNNLWSTEVEIEGELEITGEPQPGTQLRARGGFEVTEKRLLESP